MKVSRHEILKVIASQKNAVLTVDLFDKFRLNVADPVQRSRLYHPLKVMLNEKLLTKQKEGRTILWSITEFGRARLENLVKTGALSEKFPPSDSFVSRGKKSHKLEKPVAAEKLAKRKVDKSIDNERVRTLKKAVSKLDMLKTMVTGKPASKKDKAIIDTAKKIVKLKKVSKKVERATATKIEKPAQKVEKKVTKASKIVAPKKNDKIVAPKKNDKAPKKIVASKVTKAPKKIAPKKSDKAPKKVESAPAKKSGGFKKFTLKKGK